MWDKVVCSIVIMCTESEPFNVHYVHQFNLCILKIHNDNKFINEWDSFLTLCTVNPWRFLENHSNSHKRALESPRQWKFWFGYLLNISWKIVRFFSSLRILTDPPIPITSWSSKTIWSSSVQSDWTCQMGIGGRPTCWVKYRWLKWVITGSPTRSNVK